MARQEDRRTDYGLIKIHKNVIAEIAAMAAKEVEGVSRVSLNLFSRVLGLISKSNTNRCPIKITFRENNEVELCIPIVVNYGVNIPEAASRVQENVKKMIEKMTGLSASDVHIKVKGVSLASK